MTQKIARSIHIFFDYATTSYCILPHSTASYRFLPIPTASYRFLPIEGSFAVARTANDRLTNGKRTDKCGRKRDDVNAQKNLVNHVISVKESEKMVAQAKEMEPKVEY